MDTIKDIFNSVIGKEKTDANSWSLKDLLDKIPEENWKLIREKLSPQDGTRGSCSPDSNWGTSSDKNYNPEKSGSVADKDRSTTKSGAYAGGTSGSSTYEKAGTTTNDTRGGSFSGSVDSQRK